MTRTLPTGEPSRRERCLNPNQIAVFFDTDFTTAATFRAEWSVPASALVVGIPWGGLANSPSPTDEILQLLE